MLGLVKHLNTFWIISFKLDTNYSYLVYIELERANHSICIFGSIKFLVDNSLQNDPQMSNEQTSDNHCHGGNIQNSWSKAVPIVDFEMED